MDVPETMSLEDKLHQALDETRQRQAEVTALLEAARAVMEHHRFEDAARAIFDSCRASIGAIAGYVALLSEDGSENELVFLESGGLPCTVDPSLPMPIRGLRSEAYRLGQVVFDNDFSCSSWQQFMPPGHVELHHVLFAPLIIKGKTLGLLGLANKLGGFSANDARLAQVFGELAAIALVHTQLHEDRQRLIEDLEHRVEERTSELRQSVEQLLWEIETRQQVEDRLRDNEDKLRQLTSQLFTAQEQERRRLSRELHDELGQSLLVLTMQMRAIQRKLKGEEHVLSEGLEVSLRYLQDLIDNVRRLSRDLSPSILEDLGLSAALRHLVEEFLRHYDIPDFSVSIDDIDNLVPRESQINIYRIFQEILTNIGKHARPDQVSLAIQHQDGNLLVTVADNGLGFDLAEVLTRVTPLKGLGLAAMAERVKMLGGSLRIQSSPGVGTKIWFAIPLRSTEEG